MRFPRVGYLLLAIIAGAVLAMPAEQRYPESLDMRDQVVRNTQRLDSLEHQVDDLARGGSDQANHLAVVVSGLQSEMLSIRNDDNRQWTTIAWMLTFAAAQGAAVIFLMLAVWARKSSNKEDQHDQQQHRHHDNFNDEE